MADRQRVPPYLAVAAALRERIGRDEFSPGDPLPSTAALAEQYGVSRATARRAMVVLAGEGLVESTPGWGYFLAE